MSARTQLLSTVFIVGLAAIAGTGTVFAEGEDHAEGLLDLIPDAEQAARVNNNTVGLVFANDELVATAMKDLGHEVKEHADIRLVPIQGVNDVQNVYDLLFLKGVDATVVRTDSIEFVKRRGNFPTVSNVVNAILTVHQDKILILANKDISSVNQLNGKKVAVNGYGSGEFITMSVMSDILGIEPDYVFTETSDGLEQLQNGEISAVVYHFHVGHGEEHEGEEHKGEEHEGEEHTEDDHADSHSMISAFQEFDAKDSVHVLTLPVNNQELRAIYTPDTFTHDEMPNLLDEGIEIKTLKVDTLLAAYRWRPNNPRYEKSSRFVDAFLESIDHLREGNESEFWGDLDISTPVHGVSRLAVVDELLIMREREAENERQARQAQQELEEEARRVAKAAELEAQREEILEMLTQKITNAEDIDELQSLLDELNSDNTD